MGLFNIVRYNDTCKCGEQLKDFQTKDGILYLDTVNPSEIRHFHTFCDKCNLWYEYEVIVEKYRIERKCEKLDKEDELFGGQTNG